MSTIIRSDLVIEKSLSFAGPVQVAPGVMVTIKAGASMDLGGFELLNYGNIKLEGTAARFSELRNGTYSTDSTSGSLTSKFGILENLNVKGFFSGGSLDFRNTLVKSSSIEALQVKYVSDSLFINSPLDIGIESIYVLRSTFYNSPIKADAWIFAVARKFDAVNFLISGAVLILSDFFSGDHAITISNSFIDLLKGQIIDDRVFDSDDTLRVKTDIKANSFVAQPYSNDAGGFRVGAELIT